MILGARNPPHPDITRMVMWDGGWYQLIATHGYGAPPVDGVWSVWPFFPLYPVLVSGLHLVGSPYSFAQVVVANAALLVALAGVWRLARRHVSATAAAYAVWITALFPGAITFTMGYPDSLFLAGAVWAFVLLEERRPVAVRARRAGRHGGAAQRLRGGDQPRRRRGRPAPPARSGAGRARSSPWSDRPPCSSRLDGRLLVPHR